MANTLKFGNGQWASKEGSVLAYNDENNNFKPLPFDFTRASGATRVNKDGLIEVVGSDEPRIDFSNDANGALLLEPSRSNLVSYSEDFSQSAWVKTGLSVNSNQIISPDGTLNADEVNISAANSHYLFYSISVSALTNYTFTFYVKKGTATDASYSILNETNFTNIVNTTSYFNEISDTNWTRISVEFTTPSGATSIRVYPLRDGSSTGTVYIYGTQLEESSYATSYIPTSGAAVTRVADVCNNGGNNQVINSTEGVLYFEGSALVDETKQRWISLGSGSNANRVSILFNATSRISCSVRASSSALYDANFNIGSQTNYTKAAIRYKNNDFAFFVNGVKANSQLSGTLSFNSPLSELAFDSADSGSPFYGKTSQIQVFTTALTDQELIALTS